MTRATGAALLVSIALVGCKRNVIEGYPDTFAGVGLVLAIRGSHPVVEQSIEGGSAHAAGIEAGDLIERIDGIPTKGMTLGNVVAKIRGQEGSQVTLAIRREAQNIIVVVPRQKMVKTGDANEAYEKAEIVDGDNELKVLGLQR